MLTGIVQRVMSKRYKDRLYTYPQSLAITLTTNLPIQTELRTSSHFTNLSLYLSQTIILLNRQHEAHFGTLRGRRSRVILCISTQLLHSLCVVRLGSARRRYGPYRPTITAFRCEQIQFKLTTV